MNFTYFDEFHILWLSAHSVIINFTYHDEFVSCFTTYFVQEENERLKKQLEGGALPEGTMSGMSPEGG